jgi:hypothetical protein
MECFEAMVYTVQEYLILNQIQKKPYVEDLVDLVLFIIVPDVKEGISTQNKKLKYEK